MGLCVGGSVSRYGLAQVRGGFCVGMLWWGWVGWGRIGVALGRVAAQLRQRGIFCAVLRPPRRSARRSTAAPPFTLLHAPQLLSTAALDMKDEEHELQEAQDSEEPMGALSDKAPLTQDDSPEGWRVTTVMSTRRSIALGFSIGVLGSVLLWLATSGVSSSSTGAGVPSGVASTPKIPTRRLVRLARISRTDRLPPRPCSADAARRAGARCCDRRAAGRYR